MARVGCPVTLGGVAWRVRKSVRGAKESGQSPSWFGLVIDFRESLGAMVRGRVRCVIKHRGQTTGFLRSLMQCVIPACGAMWVSTGLLGRLAQD